MGSIHAWTHYQSDMTRPHMPGHTNQSDIARLGDCNYDRIFKDGNAGMAAATLAAGSRGRLRLRKRSARRLGAWI